VRRQAATHQPCLLHSNTALDGFCAKLIIIQTSLSNPVMDIGCYRLTQWLAAE
jgi:hypothetical protein